MTQTFAHPFFLLLLLFLIPMSYWEFGRKPTAMIFPSLKFFTSTTKWQLLYRLSFFLRALALIFLSLALARPQTGRSQSKQRSEGIDIMLVADASGSMNALDFIIEGKRQNRLSVVEKAMEDFVQSRVNDRIGLVVFGTYAYALCPLTLDHDVVQQYIDTMKVAMAGQETAIGDAIGVASNRLKDIPAKSKVMILLTDGESDAGKLDPREAAQAAKAVGIKIYTVGVGSEGMVPIQTPYGYQQVRLPIDEALLKDIADMTGGRYFRASDTDTLFAIYRTIDSLEKTVVDTDVYYHYDEKYAFLLWPVLVLLLLELLLRTTRFRRLP